MKLVTMVDQNGIRIDSKYIQIPEHSTNRSIIRSIKQSFEIDKKHKRLKKKEDFMKLDFYGLNISLLIPYE